MFFNNFNGWNISNLTSFCWKIGGGIVPLSFFSLPLFISYCLKNTCCKTQNRQAFFALSTSPNWNWTFSEPTTVSIMKSFLWLMTLLISDHLKKKTNYYKSLKNIFSLLPKMSCFSAHWVSDMNTSQTNSYCSFQSSRISNSINFLTITVQSLASTYVILFGRSLWQVV